MDNNLPVAFADRVKAKINESITNLLPEEDISRMVDAQINAFMRDEFQKMILSNIREVAQKQIKEALSSAEYSGMWNGYKQGVPELIADVMKKHSSEIFADMFGNMAMMVVNNMRNNRLI